MSTTVLFYELYGKGWKPFNKAGAENMSTNIAVEAKPFLVKGSRPYVIQGHHSSNYRLWQHSNCMMGKLLAQVLSQELELFMEGNVSLLQMMQLSKVAHIIQ